MKKLLVGYDVMTYNGEIPNCLDSKFLESLHKNSNFDFKNSGDKFSKTWGHHWTLYNSGFWDNFVDKKSVYEILKNHPKDRWFYLVEPFGNLEIFFGNNNQQKLLLENIPDIVLKEIQYGNAYLLINYIIDGGLGVTQENFRKIIDYTKKNWIPDSKVILIFQDFNLAENMRQLNCGYKVFDFNLALLNKAQEFVNILTNPYFSYWGDSGHDPQFGYVGKTRSTVATYDEFESSIGKNKKDFLFLCRRWKLHRLRVMSLLHKLGLNNSLISWDQRFFHEWQEDIARFKQVDDNHELIELLSTTSNFLDTQDLIKIAGYGFEEKSLYLKTYISIVGESVFFQPDTSFPSGYLSEKIWKPIGHAQPFILLGPHKSLAYLKQIGFRTFHPYIDESYDEEVNGMNRLEKILIEIKKFSDKTKQEKDDFLHNVKDIVKHNQEKFLSYPKTFHKDCGKIINDINP